MPTAHLRLALSLVAVLLAPVAVAHATEVIQLSAANWDDAVPEGKEVDCIYGDWVLRNQHVVAVIAEAVPTRNANMTVRNVGGSVIDLTVRNRQSDQLSAYYPLGSLYKLKLLPKPTVAAAGNGDGGKGSLGKASADKAQLNFSGITEDGQLTALVSYELPDDARWLKITTCITNASDAPLELKPSDAVRADGEFEFGVEDGGALVSAYDRHWRQAYGALVLDGPWRFALEEGRRPELRLEPKDGKPVTLEPNASHEIVRYLFPAADTIEVKAIAAELRGGALAGVHLAVVDAAGPVDAADVDVKSADGKTVASGRTDEKGRLVARLPRGKYHALVKAQGRGEKTLEWNVEQDLEQKLELPAPGYVVAKITGEDGGPVACKLQFRGQGETADPSFGPDSAIHGVRNLHYTADGNARVGLAPGDYEVIISHGPEFDAVFTKISVERGKETPLAAQLKRTVDTRGWLSADFHSHSTPSGDNTSSQRGRVLNLLAEHVEFAPCTEHNRLTVYDPHLAHFKAVDRMLTCPGIELTGRPLPINHQNAFPLVPKPRTQDGGGPLADVDPVVQIERLAMWDDGSDKLVQINHPNLVQMVGDKDLNGSPDGGFEKMFSFMDVIEVHPLHTIFSRPEKLPGERDETNTIFHWLQLTNLGYRLPGVVNTDAHWNFHGSGWLRNYVKSSADAPAQAKVHDLVHECEHGHIVMTNGPFLEASAKADKGGKSADVGDDLSAPEGKLKLKVRVQCPNWFTINRVQIFTSGKPVAEWNYAKRTHAKMFRQGTVVFDEELAIELASDASLVVACIGEGEGLGPVMGPDHAKDPPAAVTNPFFVDVDGDGFEPNGDMLGLPLPVEPGGKPSKGHRHHNHAHD
jgi:hypothetical protein